MLNTLPTIDWWVTVDGRPPHRGDGLADLAVGPQWLRVHPDRTRIVFGTASASTPQELWVLERFLPAAKVARR